MQLMIAILSLTLYIASAVAEEFVLIDNQTKAAYGPFTYADQNVIQVGTNAFTLRIVSKARITQENLAKGIIIPEIKFRQAHISDVVQFLKEASIQNSPAGTNVNIILNLASLDSAEKVTLSLRNMSLYDVLRYTTEILGLKLRYDNAAIVISEK